jgi:AAA domain
VSDPDTRSSCYTNHALDQFLESLVEAGIERIVRVGGQSKSEILKGMNLRELRRTENKTKNEKYLLSQLFEGIEQEKRRIVGRLAALAGLRRRTWAEIKPYLEQHYGAIFIQFSRTEREGFTKVSKEEPFEAWAKGKIGRAGGDPGSSRDINTILKDADRDIYDLPQSERDTLVEHWVQEEIDKNLAALADCLEENEKRSREQGKIYDEVDRRCLQNANVIGITTTGLAKNIEILRHVRAKVVICEEAAEVQESHILSSLLPDVEHVIQIGDHQQLRPQISNFNLSLESKIGRAYRLDESMFERLSTGSGGTRPFPVAQLNVQRRMRPDISKLIRATIYPNLTDAESVAEYPDVVGMRKNVFWLDHSNFEAGSDDSNPQQKSHSNPWEVTMVHALVRHLVRQGVYESQDIAVLTPYTGQLQNLRRELNKSFEIIISERDQEALAREGIDEVNQENPAEGGGLAAREKSLSEMLRVATV